MNQDRAEWWYACGGAPVGPLSARQLKAAALAGRFQATDLIWKEGLADWVPAGQAKGLFATRRPAADPAAQRPGDEQVSTVPVPLTAARPVSAAARPAPAGASTPTPARATQATTRRARPGRPTPIGAPTPEPAGSVHRWWRWWQQLRQPVVPHPQASQYLSDFIGQAKTHFYLARWQAESEGRRPQPAHQAHRRRRRRAAPRRLGTINWAAGLFGFAWLGYRRMYRYLALGLALYAGVDLLVLLVAPRWAVLVDLAASGWLLLRANALYRRHTLEAINRLLQHQPTDTQARQALSAAGGVSWPGAVGATLAWLGLTLGLASLSPDTGLFSLLPVLQQSVAHTLQQVARP